MYWGSLFTWQQDAIAREIVEGAGFEFLDVHSSLETALGMLDWWPKARGNLTGNIHLHQFQPENLKYKGSLDRVRAMLIFEHLIVR